MATVIMERERVTCEPAVIPYYRERANFPPNILSALYQKVCEQGLDREVFHDRAMTDEEVVRFLDKDVLTSIFLDVRNGAYVGFAYASNIEETDTLYKCLVSICIFREYWDPNLTVAFGKIFLGQLFNIVGFTTICQVTPEPNRMARAYAARVGFKRVATIPQFLSYHGETVDAVVGILTRDEFNAKE